MQENEEIREQETQTIPQEREPIFKEAAAPQPETSSCEKKKCNCKWLHCLISCLLIAAVLVLYILHFCGGKEPSKTNYAPIPTEGNGNVLFINLDSINENYFFVEEKQKEFEAEMQAQETIFKQKQANFQKKYEQFQKNYQAGILTDVQIQNTQNQLQAEYQKLENDYNAVVNSLTEKQMDVNRQMLESVQNVCAHIVAECGASFVMTYQKDLPILIYADPARDITQRVLDELNKDQKTEE